MNFKEMFLVQTTSDTHSLETRREQIVKIFYSCSYFEQLSCFIQSTHRYEFKIFTYNIIFEYTGYSCGHVSTSTFPFARDFSNWRHFFLEPSV